MIKEIELVKQEEAPPVSFCKEIEPMTRAEWVKQARMECEKELKQYDEMPMEVDFCRYVDLTGEGEHSFEEMPAGTDENLYLNEESYDTTYIKGDKEAAEQEKDSWENQKIYRPEFELSYFSKFTVRLVAAVIIAVFAISLDYFNLRVSVLDSDVIKTTIQKNDTIESVEDAVATFAKDKVLPIFQKD